MALKKKQRSVKKKTKTKALSSKKSVKKKPAVKKKKVKKGSSKKTVKKKATKKTPLKKSSKKKTTARKPISKKSIVKQAVKAPNKKFSVKKNVTQILSYLNGLEQELERILEKNRQVSIKGFEGFEYCFTENCDQPSTTGGYCRYHYMVSWGYIKERNNILSENKLKSWTTELIQNYSTRILDYMVRDLSNEKDFTTALGEMKLSPKKPVSY